ncbi:hypothetical protein [Kitasatospora cathayae]|uniref:Uncharacterized protein n=1 Tax=Kitasatospora cathayae TaxID=3004092 RepID=A0ABY7Q4D7_9ACTN|nr:hypothetical protein [Kitasatospora sp. HUAS 3-15]WBP87024.1 hypothetical protein O1G21_15020 [Kitasatospora sp. HUAS 3-15]
MAFYLIARTDSVNENEFDGFVVRAKGRRQALELVTGGKTGEPFDGFKKDGSNVRVEKLDDSRQHNNSVILASYIGS